MDVYKRRFMSPKERLDSLVEIVTESGCWIFMAATDVPSSTNPRLGYGKFWINDFKRSISAHRASWIIHKGSIPDGMIVMHRCDVPECCNPDHLRLGTAKDNTQDMIGKKRDSKCRESRRGENSNFNKLSKDQVLAIRLDTRVQRVIAEDYGVNQTCISLIKRRKNWANV